MKKIAIRLLILAVLAAAGYAAWGFYKRMPEKAQSTIATAQVRKGDIIVRSFTRAELRAVRSYTLVAPNLFGTVQVTKLAPVGSYAKDKDLIVEFDDSELLSRVEEQQLELEQTEEQIKKSQAELAIRNNQDQVELLQARYSVRRAELEVKRNDLISEIDAKKNILNQDEARQRLKQLESDIKSRAEQAQAELNTLRERRNRAMIQLARDRQRLNQTKLLAPMSGLVAVRQQRSGFGGRGVQLPDIREGDQVPTGSQVADIMDISEMEAVARVVELDRANLHEGQDVTMRLDALPDKSLNGKIKTLSGTPTTNSWSGDPTKRFEVVLTVDMRQLLSYLGAKPEHIARILAQAEQNRRRPVPSGAGGGFPGAGAMDVAGGGGPPMVGFQAPGGGRRGGGDGRAGGGMSDEQRQQMREAFQKALGGRNPQDMSEEERRKLSESMRGAGGGARGQGGDRAGARPEGERKGGRRGGGEGGEQAATPGEGGGRRGGGRRGGGGGDSGPNLSMFAGTGTAFTEAEIKNATLPAPPEKDNQLDVLLRPGLLADVEIIVEKIPDAIHVPVQAVFEKGGRQVVFVRDQKGFQERVVKPLKRSESTMIIAQGLQPGEIVALADPTELPTNRKKKQDKGGDAGGGGPMPMGGKS